MPERLHVLAALPRIDGDARPASLGDGVEQLVARVNEAWTGPPGPRLRLLPELLTAGQLLDRADEQTRAIVIYTEPGGRMEAQLAEWVKENDSRLPIVAFMAGKFMDDEEMKGMSFGHAGTIVEGEEDTATQKIARLEAAGIRVVERIDEIPTVVKEKLGVLA